MRAYLDVVEFNRPVELIHDWVPLDFSVEAGRVYPAKDDLGSLILICG